MARKRTQAGSSSRKSGSKAKTAARSRTKTAAGRSKTKTAASRTKTRSTSRSKTKTTSTRARTKTASRAKTASTRRSRPSSRTVQLRSLDDVFEQQLGDLFSAEQQLVQALPKVAAAAGSTELRAALQHHLVETEGHVDRLRQIFGRLGKNVPREHCKGMAGLLEEGNEIVRAKGDRDAKDAALIAAAQRVEHYEIAGYGTARTLAGELGLEDAKLLLDETLDEESQADELLTKLATGGLLRSGINAEAAE